jgi:P27 family predicted phage terminase small subunit
MAAKIKPPKHLRAAGAALFRDVAAEYAIEDSAGLTLLTTACEALDRMRAAQAAIKRHGETVLDRYGCVKLNPACGLEKDSRNGMVLALKCLNLDLEPVRDRVGRPDRSTTWNGRTHAN